jgi:protein-S-isoprenylcysteine O-methyltransferase Ste14
MAAEEQGAKKRWVPMPPTYVWTAIALMVGLHFIWPIRQIISGPYRYLGAMLLAAGVWFNLWADYVFRKAETAVKPFEASRTLVVHGPFRITRHPMYVGMVFALLGVFVALGSISPAFVIPVFIVVMLVRFILPEERHLEEQFGHEYREYKRRVRRWL